MVELVAFSRREAVKCENRIVKKTSQLFRFDFFFSFSNVDPPQLEQF